MDIKYISIKEHRRKVRKSAFTSFMAATLLMTGIGIGYGINPVNGFSGWLTAKAKAESTSATTVQGQAVSATKTAISSEGSITSMVEKVGPAVVTIETKTQVSGSGSRRYFASPFPQTEQTQEGMGSGFIISNDGLILTNNHVVEGASSIQVRLLDYEEPFEATVIGADEELDLAVLKIQEEKDFPVIAMGDSDAILTGDWAVAIGNPYGLDHTVTVGVISAKGRPLTIGDQHFKDLLQTDASINPGNSGGPLLNLDGEVIGINTAINAEGQGLGFAIPINTVQEVLQDLIEKGKVSRPWLGVSIQNITPEIARYLGTDNQEGAVIAYIAPDSPASRAGLKAGDIILEISGKKIANSSDLSDQIDQVKIGSTVEIVISRDGSLQTLEAVISEK